MSTLSRGGAGGLLAAAAALSACHQSSEGGAEPPALAGAREEAAPGEPAPARSVVSGEPSAPASDARVCDGSPSVRLAHFSAEGFAEDDPHWFGEQYGPSFLAIDGTCRLWTASSNSGAVFTGVLPSAVADEFARAIGFGLEPSLPGSEGDCAAGATPRLSLWTEAGTTFCCDCSDDMEEGTEWGLAMNALVNERLGGALLGEYLEPVTGPARLAVVSMVSPSGAGDAEPWPLSRGPAEAERLGADGLPGATWLGGEWGARLTDPAELASLRAARVARRNSGAWQLTPLLWVAPGAVEAEPLQMLLQDEIPEAVARAVALARRPQRP